MDNVFKTYTVVGLYPDCTTSFSRPRDGSFVEIFSAKNPKEAEKLAREWGALEIKGEDDDIEIIAVFEGNHADISSP